MKLTLAAMKSNSLGAEFMSERIKGYLEMLIGIIILLTVIFILDIATQSVFIILGVIVLFNIFVFELLLLIKKL
ncbi:hypothetical protein ACIQ57_07295 [Lysinibacillus xylanilyticus]|uniref:hypothetical protein n=1 Tax=Lysinibacillus xylanilyticus TaxID=582475 RepID=UPI00382FA7FC